VSRSTGRQLLAFFGGPQPQEIDDLRRQLRQQGEREAQAARENEELRAEIKKAAGEAARQAARLAEAQERTRKDQQRIADLEEHLEKLRKRNDADEARLRGLMERTSEFRDRFAAALKSVQVAQEHLMTTEVKLDIIEGAINVLDLRTRERAIGAEPGEE
jgi:septal ring factor EnvC (AmiA/AmiB activator)